MKVLVTGATGFLGGHVAEALSYRRPEELELQVTGTRLLCENLAGLDILAIAMWSGRGPRVLGPDDSRRPGGPTPDPASSAT